VVFDQLDDRFVFQRVLARDAVLLAAGSHRVRNFQVLRHVDANFRAESPGDPALVFQILPRHIVALGPHKAENRVLFAVFPDQRGGKPEPPYRLQLRRYAKHRRRQKVDFIINNQPPCTFPEKLKMRKVRIPVGTPGDDLIGSHGNRGDRFGIPCVLGNFLAF